MAKRQFSDDELRSAGRILRSVAAEELAKQSAVTAERWDGFLYGAILTQEVERLNPDNLADPLPWGYIGHIAPEDHLSIASVNAYLAKHPEWGSAQIKAAEGLGPQMQVARPLPQQRFQEQEILRVIRELGHDPKALPKIRRGMPGVKSAVRSGLKKFTPSVFEKAWDRLRQNQEIQDAT
jgi:hypothetical protein